MTSPLDWTICLDFGTAYSKAAVAPRDAWSNFDPSEMHPLMLGLTEEGGGNPFLLESAVFVDESRILFGRSAIARANSFPAVKRTALRSFKTLLSVSDLDRALNTAAPASVDPHRLFRLRDLVVLYLAYLCASAARAVEADPALSADAIIERRYAAPAWRSGDSAGMHDDVVRLFAEAEALRTTLGDDLLAEGGVAINTAPPVLASARARPEFHDMGMVFEATAAAAYTSIGLGQTAPYLLVLDVGAGTTDITALARISGQAEELPEARVTVRQAGDTVDRIIANIALDSARWARSDTHRMALWASLMGNMNDIKESIFNEGKALLRFEGRTLAIARRDLERHPDFRHFLGDLADAYEQSFEALRGAARASRNAEVQAIAVGGGAALPFIQDIIRRKPRRAGNIQVVARPATPDWAHAREFRGNLAPVFPQLAIAIGGALAPEAMLAASSSLSLASVDRSDSRAAHD